MGAAPAVSTQSQVEKNKIITFIDIDNPDKRPLLSMRINQDTKINDIINYLKQKHGTQNVALYYDQFRIEENTLILYNYLELLPTRQFNFKINQAVQQINQNQSQINRSQTIATSNQLKGSQNNTIASQQAIFPQNTDLNVKGKSIKKSNTTSLNQDMDKQIQNLQIAQSNSNSKTDFPIQNDTIKSQNNANQESKQILLYLLNQAQQKIQDFQQEIQELQKNNKNLHQKIQDLQNEKKTLEEQLNYIQISNNIELTCNYLKKQQEETQKQINSSKLKIAELNLLNQTSNIQKSKITLKNQCNHILEENNIQQILIKSLENKTIAKCDQCKPKFSNNILINMGFIGQTYKEFQAQYEIAQLYVNLQKNPKFILYECSQSFCSFFFIFNEKFDKEKKQSYYCPMCFHNQFQQIK